MRMTHTCMKTTVDEVCLFIYLNASTDDVRERVNEAKPVRDTTSSRRPEVPRIATPNEGQQSNAATLTESEKQDMSPGCFVGAFRSASGCILIREFSGVF